MPRRKKAGSDVVPQEATLDAATTVEPKIGAKPREVEVETILQYAGSEWGLNELKEKVIASFVADGHRRGNIKKLALYLKPEEHTVYYVVNDKVAGSVDFDV